MTRSRRSAREAGTRFESDVVKYLRDQLGDDRIERRAKSGAKDRGDVAGVRTALGERVVIEAKDVARMDLSGWVNEAETERGNDDAAVGLAVHKRRGYGPANMGGTYVTLTLDGLIALLAGSKP